MYTTLFFIIIGIIVFEFILDKYIDFLNSKWRSKPIPDELSGIYDDEKYKKQQEYSRVNGRFSSITSLFSFIVTLIFFFAFGFAKLDTFLSERISNELLQGLVYFGVLFFALDIIGIPFSIYQTFVIEEKFGFNKTTPKLFFFDKIKGYLLSMVLGALIYSVIYKLYEFTGTQFWMYCWLFMGIFMIFMTTFYSNLIVPLFNKQKALEAGALKSAIESFANKAGFKLDNIYEIDGSKRSTRANAYFTGLGSRKRIVLYDTLIKDLSVNEIVAVLAHEIGHYKKKHTLQGLFISLVQIGIVLFILSLFVSNPLLSQALGVSTPKFHIGLIAFSILYTPISTITGLLMNILSRKNEYAADNYAADMYDSEALISALKKLASNNLSNLTPHPGYVFIHYSHPSLLSRVRNLLRK